MSTLECPGCGLISPEGSEACECCGSYTPNTRRSA
jgi:hypothetical protein